MPRPKRRNKKGTVAINTRNGMLRLRFTYLSKPYDLHLGLPNSPINLQSARGVASDIEKDIALGTFDRTLAKYRPQKEEEFTAPSSTLDLWQLFTVHRIEADTSQQSIDARYKPIAANLRRFGKEIDSDAAALEFISLLRSRQSPKIANQNLSLLRGFGVWAVKEQYWTVNHFTDILPVKVTKAMKTKQNRKPFTRDEIQRLMQATTADKTLLKYRDFILFLLSSGCRPSEAIGLRWEHVDFHQNEMHICESMVRGNHGARICKGLKTEESDRILDMTPLIRTTLEGRSQGQTEGLVFLSPTGRPIDDKNFCNRIWRRLCKTAGVEYRCPYTSRSTVSSHAIKEGTSMPDVARLLGHANTRMIAQVYGKSVNRPQLPEF